ncbi:MAG: TolB family protein, partial [Candidatus Binatia bacterium]
AVLSADGRFVAFKSYATDLVPNDSNQNPDVFLRDLQSGTTILVSVNRFGTNAGSGSSSPTGISADGRFVVFYSEASDLVTNDNNGQGDVFVHDTKTETTMLVSVNRAATNSGNSGSIGAISADGRFVVFRSAASDLVGIPTGLCHLPDGPCASMFLRPVPQ